MFILTLETIGEIFVSEEVARFDADLNGWDSWRIVLRGYISVHNVQQLPVFVRAIE